jgi:hypothetical protein
MEQLIKERLSSDVDSFEIIIRKIFSLSLLLLNFWREKSVECLREKSKQRNNILLRNIRI